MVQIDNLLGRFKFELSGRIVQFVATGLLTVALARLLQPESFGLLMLAISVLTVVTFLSNLGVPESGARYVSEYKDTDPSQIPHILANTFLLNVGMVLVAATLVFLGRHMIAGRLGEPELAPLLMYGSLFVVSQAMVTYIRKILQGFEDIKLSATISAFEKVTRLVFALGLVLIGFDALGAIAGYVLSSALLGSIGLVLVYVKHYVTAARGSPMESGLRRRILEYSVPLAATNSADRLDKELDTIIVGLFLNPVAVSYYALSKQAVKLVKMPVKALGFTISPTFGAEKAKGNTDRLSRLYEQTLIHVLLVYVPMIAGLILVAKPTIQLIFGAEYLGAVPVVQVMSIYGLYRAVQGITSQALDYMGRARHRAIANGATAVANVLLNLLFVPTIGVVGAALATVIAYGGYTLLNVYIIHTELGLDVRNVASRSVLILGITAGMAFCVRFAVPYVSGWLSLFSVVALGGAVWLLLSLSSGILEREDLARFAP